MTKEFRQLLILYSISAVLFFIGFYFTRIPPIVQVIFLLLAVLTTLYTFMKSMKLLIQQFKET